MKQCSFLPLAVSMSLPTPGSGRGGFLQGKCDTIVFLPQLRTLLPSLPNEFKANGTETQQTHLTQGLTHTTDREQLKPCHIGLDSRWWSKEKTIFDIYTAS